MRRRVEMSCGTAPVAGFYPLPETLAAITQAAELYIRWTGDNNAI